MYALLLALWTAPPALSAPADPGWAAVEQDVLPPLAARAEAARLRIAARERYFAGDGSRDEAFPHLAGRDLADPLVLAGLAAGLDDADRARAAERARALPDLADPHRDALIAAREAALDAEDRAAALERRMLAGLRAHLEAHPWLARDALDAFHVVNGLPLAEPVADDPEARAARARLAAAVDADRQQLEALARALADSALIPAHPAPDPAADLGRLADGDPAAVTRLLVARPLLDAGGRAAVDAALGPWLAEHPTPDVPEDAPAPDAAAMGLLEARAAALHGARAALPLSGEDPLLVAARAWWAGRLEAAEAAVSHGQAAIARAAEASVEESARRSGADAAAARLRADEALLRAQDEAERRAAEALGAAADARAAAAAAWEVSRGAEAALAAEREQTAERLNDLQARLDALERAGPLAADRPDPDAIYGDLRAALSRYRGDARAGQSDAATAELAAEAVAARNARAREEIRSQRAAIEAGPEAARSGGLDALAQWEAALADELAALRARAEVAEAAQDEALRAIHDVQELREKVWPYVSRAGRAADGSHRIEDLVQELALLGPRLTVQAHDRLRWLRSAPQRLTDFNALRAVFVGSSWVILVLATWWLVRGRASELASAVTDRLAAARRDLRRGDLKGAVGPLEKAIETLLDLIAGALVLGAIRAISPELGFALYLYLHLAGYRFVLAAFDLAFARHPSLRPALRTLVPETHELAGSSLRAVLIWAITRRLLAYVTVDVLGLYTAGAALAYAMNLAGIGLVAWILHRWEPTLRTLIARRDQSSRLVAWLSEPPRHWLLAAPNALVGLIFLWIGFIVNVLPRVAREGTQLGSLVTMLGSYRLRTADEGGPPPRLDAGAESAILEAPDVTEGRVPRTEAIDEITRHVEAWQASGGLGIVLVAADAGEGKSMILAELAKRLESSPLRVRDVPLDHRLLTEDDALRWLADGTGHAGITDAKALDDALEADPATVWLVEDLHRAFLRTVDGFDAIGALLQMMNATSGRHLWICSVHRPAWHYLSHITDLVDTSVVRAVVQPRPMGERELRTLTVARTRAAGYEPDFASLVRGNLFGDDPAVEQERATSLFYRLLAEVSGGNPAVAMRLWVACLTPGAAPGSVGVVLGRALSEPAPDLALPDLFVLGAVRVHDWLSEDELVEVTNLGPPRVRAVLKQLVARTLLVAAGGGFEVPHGAQAAVTRALLRKNIVQW